MQHHIGIRSVSHWTLTFTLVDAAAEVSHSVTTPDGTQIIIVFTQVADSFGPNTAAPDVAVGSNLTTGPAGITRNNLALLVQNPLGQSIIFRPERLRNFGKTFNGALASLLAEKISHRAIFFGQRGDLPTDSIQFDPFFGNFGDIAVGLQKFQPGVNLKKAVNILIGDNGVVG
jgi:hypothetical protein